MKKTKLSPYFRSLKRQKRVCPECKKALLTIEPSLNINGAYEVCTKCNYIQSLTAPKEFWINEQSDETNKPADIIPF